MELAGTKSFGGLSTVAPLTCRLHLRVADRSSLGHHPGRHCRRVISEPRLRRKVRGRRGDRKLTGRSIYRRITATRQQPARTTCRGMDSIGRRPCTTLDSSIEIAACNVIQLSASVPAYRARWCGVAVVVAHVPRSISLIRRGVTASVSARAF